MHNILRKSKKISNVIKVLLVTAFIFTTAACDQPANPGSNKDNNSDSEPKLTKEEKLLIGTWAYDYGYNQDEFSNEELTFNADKTFIARYGESDYESGTYKIVNDKVHGLSIEWHFTEYGDKNEKNSSDVTSLYKCTFDDDDTVHLDRFSRDRTKMGGMLETFDPPRENTYYRIKDGTKETLTSGKWRVQKIGTPYCDWDETWTFNEDGTMVSDWLDGSNPGKKEGTYEIFKEEGKTILHQILEIGETTPAEWWYEYKTLGPNLINVNMIKTKRNGIENPFEEPYVNYYYREVETETINYHLGLGTYKHMVPKADSYTLINHPWQLEAINNHFSSYEFLGWYDNKDFTGNPVTTVTGSTRDFYAKYNLTTQYETWKNDDGSTGADYYTSLPASVVLNDEKDFQKPKRGENISILFEATLAEDIDGLTGLNFMNWDYADNVWKVFGYDNRNIKTTGKKIKEVFNFTVPDKDIPFTNSYDDYFLAFYYYEEGRNKANTFSDWKFTILDDTDSYKITYKFGDVSYVARGLKDSDFELVKDSNFFEHINWNIAQSTEILGWYENADFSGNAVTSIPAENTADKTYYAKFNLKGRRSGDWEDNGKMNHDYHVTVPVKTLVPGNEFNPKPGDTVNIYFEATLSNDLNQWAGWHLQSDNGWIARDVGSIVTSDKKLSKIFTIKIDDNVTLPSVDELYFDFWYSKEAYDGIITFSDWKFVLLDETNSYNITYNYGNFSETVKAFGVEKYNLPITTNELNSIINWQMAEQEFLGWYDNSAFEGNAVTSIAAENQTDKEFWMKYNLKTCRRDWDDNGTPNHLWDSEIPLAAVIPDFDVSKLKQGTTIKIKVTATPSVSSFNKYFLRLVDCSNEGWKDVAWTEESEVLVDNKISHTFNLNVDTDAFTSELKDILFGIGYNKETYDESITLSDWKFVLLDETNSYNINYHFGNMVYTEREYTGNSFTLPTDLKTFESFDWNIANNIKFVEWKDGSGSTITEIPADNTTDKDVYLKFNPFMSKWCANGDELENDYYFHLPAKMFLSESDLNNKLVGKKDVVKIEMTATINKTPDTAKKDRIWVELLDLSNCETQTFDLKDGILTATFEITPYDEVTAYPSADDLYIDFVYLDDFCSDYIEFTDLTLKFVE